MSRFGVPTKEKEMSERVLEAARRWLNVGPDEIEHPLIGQAGCPHCAAESELRVALAAWLEAA